MEWSDDIHSFMHSFRLFLCRAMRRRHCVGGGAPVKFGRRSQKFGVGAGWRPKNFVFRNPEKISFYFYSASSSPLLLKGASVITQIHCRNFTPKRLRKL